LERKQNLFLIEDAKRSGKGEIGLSFENENSIIY
jgi:hypothetical protein